MFCVLPCRRKFCVFDFFLSFFLFLLFFLWFFLCIFIGMVFLKQSISVQLPGIFYHPSVLKPFITPNYLVSLGSGSTSFWNSIFTSNEDRTHASAKDNSASRSYAVPTPNLEHSFSTIQLREVRNLINFPINAVHIHWVMEGLLLNSHQSSLNLQNTSLSRKHSK